MSLIRVDPLKDAGKSVMFAGLLMFGGFVTYYYFLFYLGFSRLSDLIVMWWSAIPNLADPQNLGALLFLFRNDFPAISFALNSTLTISSILIYVPFICAVMVCIVGLFVWKKRGKLRVWGWLLISLIVLAFFSFFQTFVLIFPIVLLGVFLLLGCSVFAVLHACWTLLKASRKTGIVEKVEYVSIEKYWRLHRIPDEVIYVTVLIFIAFIVAILVLAVGTVYQQENSEYLINVIRILKSIL
ncbi:MAG: hypothetical protein QW261_04865 [Candidatus Jordarchaeaceae archaeon]